MFGLMVVWNRWEWIYENCNFGYGQFGAFGLGCLDLGLLEVCKRLGFGCLGSGFWVILGMLVILVDLGLLALNFLSWGFRTLGADVWIVGCLEPLGLDI